MGQQHQNQQPLSSCSPLFSMKENYNPFIETLINNMTLREKIGQLAQINLPTLYNQTTNQLDTKLLQLYANEYQVGSYLNNPIDGRDAPPPTKHEWAKVINQLQEAHGKNRLKIPMIYGLDSVHGANYVYDAILFPQQLGLASSFNRDLVKRVAAATAKDTRAVGVHWNFAPILDIAVNKQWPRTYETFGEDPYLASELGISSIQGFQGCSEELRHNDNRVAATMKHFIGYSSTRSGKDVDGSWMSLRVINDYFRLPFQRAVENGIATAMESYSDIEGDHLVNSKAFLVDLLREKMGFKGALVTDFQQIQKLVEPIHIAETQLEAVYKVMKLGSVDMSMIPNDYTFIPLLESLVEQNKISMDLINQNVRRILTLKYQVGLFDSLGKVDTESKNFQSIGSLEDQKLSLEAARESIILLHNPNNKLPLNKNAKILVTGPTANSIAYQNGGWTYQWQGTSNESFFKHGTTLLNGLMKYGQDNVKFINTLDIQGNKMEDYDSFFKVGSQFDFIVVGLGEANYAEFKGNIQDMSYPLEFQFLLKDIQTKINKPIILVLNQGRPRVIQHFNLNQTEGILNGFLAGPYAGEAMAEIIYGITNPSGKLPISYTNKVNDNTYNYYHRFNEVNPYPQWPFGHGLSYTQFKYSDLILSDNIWDPIKQNQLTLKVTIQNIGSVKGMETILVYITDEYRSLAPEVKKMKRFEKIELLPNEKKTLQFNLKLEDLWFSNLDNNYVVEKGNFTIQVNDLKQRFKLDWDHNNDEQLILGK